LIRQTSLALGLKLFPLTFAAAYLFVAEGIGRDADGNPWRETRRRKPSKAADGRLERAAQAYEELRKARTRKSLPKLPAL
jgi:uncharacterized protein